MSPTRRLASASSFCCFALCWPGQRRPRRLSIMRKALPVLILLPALALGGCSIFGSKQPKSLDEFAVARNAPLVIPPDYSLTPPGARTVSTTRERRQGQAV